MKNKFNVLMSFLVAINALLLLLALFVTKTLKAARVWEYACWITDKYERHYNN